MKVTIKWRGNEDGSLRFIVGSRVEELRAEVLTPVKEHPSTVLNPSATLSITPTLPKEIPIMTLSDDVEGCQLTSVSVRESQIGAPVYHGRRWIHVTCAGHGTAVPILFIPKWEVLAASFLTSTAAIVAAGWAFTIYSALPHGPWLDASNKVVGLPLIAAIGANIAGIFGPRHGGPPLAGLLHRVDRAAMVALATVGLVVATNRALCTVRNDTDFTVPLGKGTLAAHERILIPRGWVPTSAGTYDVRPGRGTESWVDGLLGRLEPAPFVVSPLPVPVPASLVVGRCTKLLEPGSCDIGGSPDGKVTVLYGDAVGLGQAPGAVENSRALARLLVSLPVNGQLPDWHTFTRATLRLPPNVSRSPKAFFVGESGNSLKLLELSASVASAQSPVAVTPFLIAHQEIVASIDEDLQAPTVNALEDAAVRKAQKGGELTCAGLGGEVVEIVPLRAVASDVHKLEVTMERPGKQPWSSIFVPHAEASSARAWLCKPPSDDGAVPKYTITQAGTEVSFWGDSSVFAYEIVGQGTGTCRGGSEHAVRRYSVEYSIGEVEVSDKSGKWSSTYRTFHSRTSPVDVWLCAPSTSTLITSDVWTKALVGKNPAGLRASSYNAQEGTIVFPKSIKLW